MRFAGKVAVVTGSDGPRSSRDPAAPGARVPLRIKLAYGSGAAAFGIKDNGFAVFLLLFYNQVVGLPADQVGLAIMVALFVDAFVDPAVGSLSDRTDTRIGRRHPWLYASALPIALSWVMLWHPPAGSDALVLGYLVVVAILVRTAIACNEVPAAAMMPELTRDYHERTSVIRYRYLFGWLAGLAMLMLAYGVLLAPPLGSPTGPLAPQGYLLFGIVGAAAMAVSVLVSAIGTHRRLARRPAQRIARQPVGAELRAIIGTLGDRNFLRLMAAGLCAYINQGIVFATINYLLQFVWLFEPRDFLFYSVALFGGVLIAFVMVTPAARRFGKKETAAMFLVIAATLGMAPYWLRLADLFPRPGDPQLLPILLGLIALATSFSVCVMMLIGSMCADVVEASEERTGQREEGLFFAGNLFMQKCTSGLGIFVSGLILSFAGFPDRAVPGAVPVAVLDRLTLAVSLTILGISLIGAWLFTRYPIGRAEHEARLAKLAVAAPGEAAETGG